MFKISDIIGLPLSKDHVVISETSVLDKITGFILPIEKFVNIKEGKLNIAVQHPTVSQFKEEVEIVAGVGKQKINLSLLDQTGVSDVKDGFLIEVFTSGSDGKLTRVYREELVDELDENVVREGFEHFIILSVDDE